MQSSHGVFIVLEGSDGSGKGTQFDLLKKRLSDAGYQIEVFDFPRYDKPSSHFVRKYLNGEYGPANTINPYTASLFFALDRFEAAQDIRAALEAGKIVLSNRYVGSNMAHQGAKFKETIEKRSFFVWEDSLEFQLLNIPRPNISLFLRVPAETSYELIKQKAARSYTDKSHDEHEADIEHLRSSVETYDLLCQLFPKDFKAIDCAPNGELLSIEAINAKIWDAISGYLPHIAKEVHAPAPEEALEGTPAEPSRTGEPDIHEWQVDRLSLHAIIELAKMGMSVNIKCQDSWNGTDSRYEFYTPEALSKDSAALYKKSYSDAAQAYKDVYKHLIEHYKQHGLAKTDSSKKSAAIAQLMVPMGAIFKSVIRLNKDDAAKYMASTRSSSLPEIQNFGKALAKQVLTIWPSVKAEEGSVSDVASPKAINEILAELGNSGLPQTLSDSEQAKLLDALPKNEFDLLADGLYSYSDLSRAEIIAAIEKWNYQQKTEALTKTLKENPQILDAANYRFDALNDRVSMVDLLKRAGAASLKVQQPTVRYGYNVPEDIEAANLEDKFLQVFDDFLGLFSQLQGNDESHVTDYATLAGHKVRWQGSLSASTLKELKSCDTSADFAPLLSAASEAHPIVGEYLANEKTAAAPKSSTSTRKRSRRGKK